MSGMPSSRPRSPAASRASAAAALESASSAVTVITAFKAGFRRSIRARKCRVRSTLDICLSAKRSASSPMEKLCNIRQKTSTRQGGLFDHSRYDVQAGLHPGRVGLVLLVVVGLHYRVRPQSLVLTVERMRH